MPVQVQQEEIDHCRVALTIEVPPDEIEKATEAVFNQVAKRTNVPGFRPGKAPRHLVKRYIDESRVKEMALDRALNNAFRDALKQTNLTPYTEAEPKVEFLDEEPDPDKGFSFKATVALPPHVHMGELDGLAARKLVTKITDADVDKEIERYRERAATYQPTDEPSKLEDRIRATVEISREGVAVPEASFTEPALLQIGTNLDEFDQGLTGIKAGEEKSFDFVYPEDFASEELRGKTATAQVQASEVLRRTLPAADDEFAKKLGLESLEELQTRVRETLQAQADALANQEVDDKLIREVVQRSHVHFPDEMVEREVADRMNNLLLALDRRGETLDGYLRSARKDLKEFEDELREEARESIVTTLSLLEVAHANDVRITEQDVEAEIKRRAESEGVKVSAMRRLLHDTGEIEQIRNRLFFRKVADFLRSKAEITEIEG